LDGQLSKLFVTLAFSINFRSQIENQARDYMLLGASRSFSFFVASICFYTRMTFTCELQNLH